MVKLPKSPEADIDKWLSGNAADLFGYPIKLEGHKLPINLALSQPLPNFGLNEDLSNISNCLIDYSEGDILQSTLWATVINGFMSLAILIDSSTTRPEYRQPTIIRALEVTLGYPWSTSIDIWTVGCLVR